MSRTRRNTTGKGRERRISVRAVRREQPDVRKLSRALLDIVKAQAEAEAAAQDRTQTAETDEEQAS